MFLVIEDNPILWKNLVKLLQLNWFDAELSTTSNEAIQKLKNWNYEFIILDINLPDESWFDLLKKLREEWNNIPILILTSRNTIDDKVKWLELGADDYMTKPFDMSEFIARIKAILRRQNWIKSEEIILNNWIKILPSQQKVIKNWSEIWLSDLEFRLLMYLLKNKWKILSRKDIYENVWWDFEDYYFSRTVDVYIWNLRKKLWKDIIKTKKWVWYYIP